MPQADHHQLPPAPTARAWIRRQPEDATRDAGPGRACARTGRAGRRRHARQDDRRALGDAGRDLRIRASLSPTSTVTFCVEPSLCFTSSTRFCPSRWTAAFGTRSTFWLWSVMMVIVAFMPGTGLCVVGAAAARPAAVHHSPAPGVPLATRPGRRCRLRGARLSLRRRRRARCAGRARAGAACRRWAAYGDAPGTGPRWTRGPATKCARAT